MIIKLWYPKRGEFVKEIKLLDGLELTDRFTLLRYECDPHSAKVRPIHWVFKRVEGVGYEYSHKESVL